MDKNVLSKKKEKLLNSKYPDIHTLIDDLRLIFNYLYNKKVYILRIKDERAFKSLKKEYLEFLHNEKIERHMRLIEDYELFHGLRLTDVEGGDILRRLKAQYAHCKRFFSQEKLR